MNRGQTAYILAKEFIILHRARHSENETISMKSLEKELIETQDPISLIKAGYLELLDRENFPDKCLYKITEEGKKYLDYAENILNSYSP